MHVKCWIFDRKVLLTGSCNLTHNAVENNIEQLLRITTPSVVRKALEDFEKHWDNAIEIPLSELEANAGKQAQEKMNRKQNSRSVSRSLSNELAEPANSCSSAI